MRNLAVYFFIEYLDKMSQRLGGTAMRPNLLHNHSNHLDLCRIVLPHKTREKLKLKIGQNIPFSWGKYRADAFIEGKATGGIDLIFGNEVHTCDEQVGMKWEEGVLKIGPLI